MNKSQELDKYLTEFVDAEWAKTKRELDVELSRNDPFPSPTNNESISSNMEIKDVGSKVWNSSEQAISTIFADVARDSWPYEGEDPNYFGSKVRNEIETKDSVVEENELKMDKIKSPQPSTSWVHSNQEKTTGNEDPWIPISVEEEIPSFADFENDDEVNKTNVESPNEYFQYSNDYDYQLYNMDTGRIVDLDHNGHEVFVGTVNIIGRYEMKQYPGMIQRLCNDIDKGWCLL